MKVCARAAGALLFLMAAGAADAMVTDKSATGFTVTLSATVPRKPADAYAAFLKVDRWWSSDHTFSRDAKNLSMDVRPGGCWCETLPDGGFVRHAEVIHAAPGKKLVFSGARGPLQTMGVGILTATFAASGEATTVTLVYAVGGHDPDNFEKWSTAVDRVLGEELSRYSDFVTKGAP